MGLDLLLDQLMAVKIRAIIGFFLFWLGGALAIQYKSKESIRFKIPFVTALKAYFAPACFLCFFCFWWFLVIDLKMLNLIKGIPGWLEVLVFFLVIVIAFILFMFAFYLSSHCCDEIVERLYYDKLIDFSEELYAKHYHDEKYVIGSAADQIGNAALAISLVVMVLVLGLIGETTP